MAGWLIWLIIAGVLFVVEMLTFTFYLLWLSVGAAAAALTCLVFPELISVQLLTGGAVSLILTIFTKPLTKWIKTGSEFRDSILELVGKEGVVVEAIAPGKPGIVKIGNESWSATAAQPIEAGQYVTVIHRGTTMLEVEKLGG